MSISCLRKMGFIVVSTTELYSRSIAQEHPTLLILCKDWHGRHYAGSPSSWTSYWSALLLFANKKNKPELLRIMRNNIIELYINADGGGESRRGNMDFRRLLQCEKNPSYFGTSMEISVDFSVYHINRYVQMKRVDVLEQLKSLWSWCAVTFSDEGLDLQLLLVIKDEILG